MRSLESVQSYVATGINYQVIWDQPRRAMYLFHFYSSRCKVVRIGHPLAPRPPTSQQKTLLVGVRFLEVVNLHIPHESNPRIHIHRHSPPNQ